MAETELKKSITKNIDKMQKEVTILFTDIEDSTQYWHAHGDVEGRLMVDRHNRILFPLVKKFKGRIVKTIGDSIMAMFKRPSDALNAAIAMQQALLAETEFPIKIRIGIHTGNAIVEHNDVYGDVVNVAARVESQSEGAKIALSSKTIEALKSKENYTFKKGESFTPKGKSRKMALFFCEWEAHDDLIADHKVGGVLPFASQQKIEVLIYLFTTLGFFYFFMTSYLRYFISDYELFSTFVLNPKLLISEYTSITAGVGLVLFFGIYKLIRLKSVPHVLFKALKGSFIASFVYWFAFFALPFIPASFLTHGKDVLYKTDHLIVTVLEDETALKEQPNSESKTLFTVDNGTLLLLTDVKAVEETVWNKVLIRKKVYGWVERVVPPAMGVAEKRLTKTNNFIFYHLDGYMVLLSLLGFMWGYRSFKVKPF